MLSRGANAQVWRLWRKRAAIARRETEEGDEAPVGTRSARLPRLGGVHERHVVGGQRQRRVYIYAYHGTYIQVHTATAGRGVDRLPVRGLL